MDDKEFAESVAASTPAACRELGRRAALISADYLNMSAGSMREGAAQFVDVFLDLSRSYQKLSDVLYAEADTLEK